MKQTKLARLEKSVDSTLSTVDKLIQILSATRDEAATLVAKAEDEVELAKAVYDNTRSKCVDLQKRCLKATSFVDKILNQ